MNFEMLLKASTRLKNLALLAVVGIVFLATTYLPFLLVGLAGYVYFVMQTLRDEKFLNDYNNQQQIEGIQNLNIESNKLYRYVSGRLRAGMREKVTNIFQEKESLMIYYNNVKDDLIKQKIVEQALKLVLVYFKLMYNYSVRIKDIKSLNTGKVEERINNNRMKKENLINPKAKVDIEKALELDERLLERINREKNELEMVHSKLDYIESAIITFKHQIISNSDLDPEISEIDNVVNEAVALDNVLLSRKGRIEL